MKESRFSSLFSAEVQTQLSEEVKLRQFLAIFKSRENRTSALSLFRKMREGWFGKRSLSANDQDLMSFVNGEHTRVLGNKTAFPKLVNEIGYTSPKSVIISISDSESIRQQKLNNLFDEAGENARYFAKPVNGTWQRNLVGLENGLSKIEAIYFALSLKGEDYLIQEYIPTNKDDEWRYIRYKAKDGQVYVACFQYGLNEDEKKVTIPVLGKRYMKSYGVDVNEFLTELKSHEPIIMPEHHREKLQVFIEQFIADLENKLGEPVSFLSMDIGILDQELLDNDTKIEEMKQKIVFYETQTTPQPWQLKNHDGKPNYRKGYFNLWKLMFKERGADILARVRNSEKFQ